MKGNKRNLAGLVLMAVITILIGFAVALFTAPASAAEVGTIENKSGGTIVFTDVARKGSDALVVYANASDGTMITGEWVAMERGVMVRWDDGTLSLYPYASVTLTNKPKAKATGTSL